MLLIFIFGLRILDFYNFLWFWQKVYKYASTMFNSFTMVQILIFKITCLSEIRFLSVLPYCTMSYFILPHCVGFCFIKITIMNLLRISTFWIFLLVFLLSSLSEFAQWINVLWPPMCFHHWSLIGCFSLPIVTKDASPT